MILVSINSRELWNTYLPLGSYLCDTKNVCFGARVRDNKHSTNNSASLVFFCFFFLSFFIHCNLTKYRKLTAAQVPSFYKG